MIWVTSNYLNGLWNKNITNVYLNSFFMNIFPVTRKRDFPEHNSWSFDVPNFFALETRVDSGVRDPCKDECKFRMQKWYYMLFKQFRWYKCMWTLICDRVSLYLHSAQFSDVFNSHAPWQCIRHGAEFYSLDQWDRCSSNLPKYRALWLKPIVVHQLKPCLSCGYISFVSTVPHVTSCAASLTFCLW